MAGHRSAVTAAGGARTRRVEDGGSRYAPVLLLVELRVSSGTDYPMSHGHTPLNAPNEGLKPLQRRTMVLLNDRNEVEAEDRR
ncbi:hypothetical protein GN956_G2624 [Arapaima gigas]